MSHVTLTLFRFDGLAAKLWAFSQMGLARRAIGAMDGLTFYKMMGTGGGAGFSTRPNLSCYTLLCVWENAEMAEKALVNTPALQRYRSHTNQTATLHLQPTQSRGQWSGHEPFHVDQPEQGDPVVALTRAALAPAKVWQFWSHVPSISDAIQQEPTMRFMMGMGEVPWMHQVTFSIWDDREAMTKFSRESATHGEAVKLAYRNGWFKENLFARFNLIKIDGAWDGLENLAKRLHVNDNLANAA